MPEPRPPPGHSTLSFKLGRWLEAQATGWGVIALTLLAIVLAVAVLVAGLDAGVLARLAR